MVKNKGHSKSKKEPQAQQSKTSQSKKLLTVACGIVVVAVLWIRSENSHNLIFALQSETYTSKSENVTCSSDYKNYPKFDKCTPTKLCGRGVKDGLVTEKEVEELLDIVKSVMQYGGSHGGASILDLHSGALSKGEKFINIYKVLSNSQLKDLFPEHGLQVFKNIKDRVRHLVAHHFGINHEYLFLTKPTFFSRITSKEARTQHDEYWHSHIDKIQYGSFDYTSLLYLSNYGQDFQGGQFVFDDRNITVEPKLGRISFFTSGSENPHHVKKVTEGVRYALTISFTCDPKHAIKDELWNGEHV